ncbi:hypothetical protein HWV62_32896 [Athelia sp. TMB]|nr:hypothetical protein HWV62_32896 [Athelia sp. TMB]
MSMPAQRTDLPTKTSIDGISGYLNFHIPPAYQAIKDRVEADSAAEIHEGNKAQVLNDLGITAAVQTMIYTDALDAEVDEESLPEDDPAQPEYVQKIEKELCWDCTDKIWALGEKYHLGRQDRRQVWLKCLNAISEMVRATWPGDIAAKMAPFNNRDEIYEFHASIDEDDPVVSEEE